MKDDQILYTEKLPKFVFAGDSPNKSFVIRDQWITRLFGIFGLVVALYIILIISSERISELHSYFGVILVLLASAFLFYKSEWKIQSQLDGSIQLTIFTDRISIPPRKLRKLFGKSDFILKTDIHHVEVRRGNCIQYISEGESVIWDYTPVEIIIIDNKKKRHRLGLKPPNTIMDALGVFRNSWDIRIEFPGTEMGTGTIYSQQEKVKELSYEEIIKMNLFEWEG